MWYGVVKCRAQRVRTVGRMWYRPPGQPTVRRRPGLSRPQPGTAAVLAKHGVLLLSLLLSLLVVLSISIYYNVLGRKGAGVCSLRISLLFCVPFSVGKIKFSETSSLFVEEDGGKDSTFRGNNLQHTIFDNESNPRGLR